MPNIDVKNWDNQVVGTLELPEEVFGKPLNRHLLWHYVRVYLAHQRQGNAATKTRAEVAGAGRKLWKQKGTGRARIGSVRSPLWRHGGTVHGPQPRAYDLKINRKEKQEALRQALSQKLRTESCWVLDSLVLEAPKTKELSVKLRKLGLGAKVLLVDGGDNANLKLAARNMPAVHCEPLASLNAYTVLKSGAVLFSREAITKISEVLAQ
jgi:large subunit ribosomal protein L4